MLNLFWTSILETQCAVKRLSSSSIFKRHWIFSYFLSHLESKDGLTISSGFLCESGVLEEILSVPQWRAADTLMEVIVHRLWDVKIMFTGVCCVHGATCQPAPLFDQALTVTRKLVRPCRKLGAHTWASERSEVTDLPTAFLFNHLCDINALDEERW